MSNSEIDSINRMPWPNLTKSLREGFTTIKRLLPSYPLTVWGAIAAPFALMMAMVGAVGPQLQAHTLPLSISIAPTIYDTVYPDSLARFVSLQDWLTAFLGPGPLALGAIVALAALRAKTVHGFALHSGAAFVLAYTAYDVVLVTFFDVPTSLSGSIISNIAGGLGVIAITYVSLAAIKYVIQVSSGPVNSYFLTALTFIFLGLTISFAVYSTIIMFYRPLKANIDITIDRPFEGDFSGSSKAQARDRTEGDSIPSFSFLPNGAKVKEVNITSPHEAGELDWSRSPKGPSYSVELFFFEGCISADRMIPTGPASIRRDGISTLHVEQGSSDITVGGKGPLSVTLNTGSIFYAWVKKPSEDGIYNLNLFLPKEGKILLEARSEISISAVTFLLSNSKDGVSPATRSVRYRIDGKTYSLTGNVIDRRNPDALLRCRQIKLTRAQIEDFERSGTISVESRGQSIGIYWRLLENPQLSYPYSPEETKTRISSMNGWADFRSTDANNESYLGRTGFASFSASIRSMTVYGSAITSGVDRIFLVGDFEVYNNSDGSIRMSGNADAVFRNADRLNKTRWEMISDGFRLLLFASLSTAFATIFAFSRKSLGGSLQDDPKDWFSQ